MEQEVLFYSEGLKVHGDICIPDGLAPGEKRAALVLCQGFATAKSAPSYIMARALCQWGYVALNFDYRGFGDSEGPRGRMIPTEQVQNARDAISFLQQHPAVDPLRIGMYGASFGGSIAVYATGLDARVRCLATAVSTGSGSQFMRGMRKPWEWRALMKDLEADAVQRAATGKSRTLPRGEVIIYEPEVAARMAKAPAGSGRVNELPLESVQAILDFHADLMASRILTAPTLFLVAENDARAPMEGSRDLYAAVRAPKRWVSFPGAGHDSMYSPPLITQHDGEVRDWFGQHLPARG